MNGDPEIDIAALDRAGYACGRTRDEEEDFRELDQLFEFPGIPGEVKQEQEPQQYDK